MNAMPFNLRQWVRKIDARFQISVMVGPPWVRAASVQWPEMGH